MDEVKSGLRADELVQMSTPDSRTNEPDAYTSLMNMFTQRNIDSLVKCMYLRSLLQHYQSLSIGRQLIPSVWTHFDSRLRFSSALPNKYAIGAGAFPFTVAGSYVKDGFIVSIYSGLH